MGLAFEIKPVTIPQSNGPVTLNDGVSFDSEVVTAEVALRAIKLDYVGGPREGDITQVGVTEPRIGGKRVDFRVKVNYSAATYTGEVTVLVIAETKGPTIPTT